MALGESNSAVVRRPNSNSMPLDQPLLFKQLVQFGIDHVLNFVSAYEQQYMSDVATLQVQTHDESEDVDYLMDEKDLLDQVLKLSLEMGTVALYRVVELNSQRLYKWRWSDELIKKKQLFRVDKLRRVVKTELGIDIASLPAFLTVDELRCANNAVKHDGLVTTQLAVYKGWTAGEPLDNLKDLLDRAQLDVPVYMHALASAILPIKRV